VQSSTLQAEDLTVSDSHLINTYVYGQARRIEGNTGSCAQALHHSSDWPMDLYLLPSAAVVVQNNQMPGCRIELHMDSGQPPQAMSIVSNTLAGLIVYGYGMPKRVPVEIRDNVLLNDGPPTPNGYVNPALGLYAMRGQVSVTGNTLESMELNGLTGPETFIRNNTLTLTVRTWPFAVTFGATGDGDASGALTFEGNTIMILTGLIQGVGSLTVVLAVYTGLLLTGYGEGEARMMSFVCLVIANLGMIFANRSWTRSIIATLSMPNKALWWVSGGAIFFLTLVIAVPFLRDLFQFAPVHRWEIVLIAGAGLVSILISESVKLKAMRQSITNGSVQPMSQSPTSHQTPITP